jgi:transposase
MMLLEFARLPEAETGEWLRKKGLQSEHLKLWESELTTKSDTSQFKEETRILRNTNKQLEKDLLKKDKALAELSAIIILQKKMADLFPREEET